ncbi:hypothetical protein AvCA_48770 [Azotobacter vinelandii CA]|uniref:HNH domain-containing protein n=2 Tax=Azotobacter vinelandii TaxID=354 RepID=C1DK72_AZOVD|nr:HNH endonuclease [Azotobacter vinelandii]ACO80977.1 Conserved hypothetical protein [Azotobacter vinelandii DJ]AGK15838.1 hypothetical protein AvCA_48770 [Azotobacter vinelandii CA]AGK22269.1 hypothetical protein AvCA6_48770 [Azotobacter vinelandii CA6]WKN21768.1 HNH endonuclease [Azotobacter vinelandii]GLK60547.1 HNH endonuclease [Azotobacter vinelandii]
MSRKKFIEAQGATCRNWTWSWSFINEGKKVIIFGAWDTNTDGDTSLILSDTWEYSERGRKQPAYEQSREHIRLIEEEGYELQTFPIIYSGANKDKNGIGPAKIEGFIPELSSKILKRVGGKWYASDGGMGNQLAEEIDTPENYIEGASKMVSVNTYERSADARAKCVARYGYSCSVCGFDFEAVYGEIGQKYIHVHHIVPLAEIAKEYVLDPVKDLIPVCANCHAIIHRTRPALTIEQLKAHLAKSE